MIAWLVVKTKSPCLFRALKIPLRNLKKMDGAVGPAITEALQESYNYVTAHLEDQIEQHHRTGKTAESLLKNEKVQVEGTTYYINVGFDVGSGGLASIFLMYGTPKHTIKRRTMNGTKSWNHPGMDADAVLYDLVFGPATKSEIEKIQKRTFERQMEGLL